MRTQSGRGFVSKMSILGDGYRYGGSSSSRRIEREKVKENQEDDLLVFGYSCKLYRDDEKALLEDNGALLLPWMGDETLMVDRYVLHELIL